MADTRTSSGSTAEPRLADMGAELALIGDRWEQVAVGFDAAARADEPAALLDAATKPMHEIADREQDFWSRLDTRVAG